MKEETCKDCKYFMAVDGGSSFCRESPPRITSYITLPNGNPLIGSSWPPVGSDQWCGRWHTKLVFINAKSQ